MGWWIREKRREGNISHCVNNLSQIKLALLMYPGDHGGAYPPDFRELIPYLGGRRTSPSLFVCYGSGHARGSMSNVNEWTDYVYIANLTESDPVSAPIVFCPADNHYGRGALVIERTGGRLKFVESDSVVDEYYSKLPKESRDRVKILRARKQIKKKP